MRKVGRIILKPFEIVMEIIIMIVEMFD